MENFVLPTGGGNGLISEELAFRKLNLDGAIGVLRNILDLQASQIPEIFRQYQFPATDKVACLDKTVIPTMPWISVRVSNDGPGQVYVFINEKKDIREHECLNSQRSNSAALLMGESKEFDMGVGGIDRVYLQCDPGYTTSVRMFSTGKRPISEEVDVNGV